MTNYPMPVLTEDQRQVLIDIATKVVKSGKMVTNKGVEQYPYVFSNVASRDIHTLVTVALSSLTAKQRKTLTCSSCKQQWLHWPIESQCQCMGDGAYWIETSFHTTPVPVLKLPEDIQEGDAHHQYINGFHECLDEIKRLNGVDE